MKEGLRRDLLQRRLALSEERRSDGSRQIVERLEGLPLVRRAHCIAGYHPLPSEASPMGLLVEAARRGVQIALPRTASTGLELRAWLPGDELVRSRFGVQEPRPHAPLVEAGTADVVLVPGVAFDRTGHRLGWGHGYYDRLLAPIRRERLIGIAFDEQVVDRLPSQAHDVPIAWLVTPRDTLHFEP